MVFVNYTDIYGRVAIANLAAISYGSASKSKLKRL